MFSKDSDAFVMFSQVVIMLFAFLFGAFAGIVATSVHGYNPNVATYQAEAITWHHQAARSQAAANRMLQARMRDLDTINELESELHSKRL